MAHDKAATLAEHLDEIVTQQRGQSPTVQKRTVGDCPLCCVTTGLARNLAHTYCFRNVRTNVVNPGACVTDILGNAMDKWSDRDIMDAEGQVVYNERGAVALGLDADGNNLTGFPEDIANAILYLISDEAHYVNGAQLNVDGGWTSF